MSDDQTTEPILPRWAPRVRQQTIRRLYFQAAAGVVDEFLVDEVGIALYLRCQSILTVTEAASGRAPGPRCETVILHSGKKYGTLVCDRCGWQAPWTAYQKTYQGKQLHGGAALFAFREYVQVYSGAANAAERLLLIDRLLHVFHGELAQQAWRPAASNLIGGTVGEVLDLLDSLTYGSETPPALERSAAEWRKKAESGPWLRKTLEERRARRQGMRTGD